MRKLEFIPNPNGFTKILLNDVELKTRIDPYMIRDFKLHTGYQYNVEYGYHIIQSTMNKIVAEVPLDQEEVAFTIKYLRKELGL